ncbi:hypothetical protein HME9304_01809 [Flagellimonas maritima]|uniref:Uncharacterized protein n=1 Tax=Flagellimonas maritima TaxID=1383885 RepID=A0A2Z4LT92_9FLAO|nr:DUF6443 domain-containing protein [Allomuricauda aurantiaca]AWX44804.1 hypothetical protein HME9304_01809 [Allomuricauda aurantiaca]
MRNAIILTAILFSAFVRSQSIAINGPTDVDVNYTANYSLGQYINPNAYPPIWSITGGTIISFDGQNISIYWHDIGVHTLSLEYDQLTLYASLDVTVSAYVYNPPNPVIDSNTCNSAIIRRSGSPPAGVTWYWQGTDVNGTSTSLGSASTYNVNASGTYYIRAWDNNSGEWSPDLGFIDVNIIPYIGGTIAGNQTICYGTEPSPLNNQSVASGGTSYSYQWEESTDDGVSYTNINGATSTSYTPAMNLTSTTKYRREVTSCGLTEYSNVVTVNVRSSIGNAVGANVSNCSPGSIDLTATPGTNADSVRWFETESGGSPIHVGSSFSTPFLTESKTYYVESISLGSGCVSDNRTVIQANITSGTIWYADGDLDGLGDPNNSTPPRCSPPDNGIQYVTNNNDLCPDISSETNICSMVISENPNDHNYIYEIVYQDSSVSSTALFVQDDRVLQRVVYFDGLGREIQNIGIGQSPDKDDIIRHIEYNGTGLMEKGFLPFTVQRSDLGHYISSSKSNTLDFYDDFKYENTSNPFTEIEFEPSPLNRVLKQAAPGEDWKMGSGHEIEFGYGTNITGEVQQYTVSLAFANNTYTPTLVEDGHYPQGELYKMVTKDENHDGTSSKLHTTESYTDKLGHVVLKRTYGEVGSPSAVEAHDTHYVYDDYGNLTFVLPPKVDTSNGVSSTELNELCYQYKYDNRNRLVEKKVPGKGWELIVYNKLHWPIMTQNALQDSKNEWSYTKYDAFGRIIVSGVLNLNLTRLQAQTNADNAIVQYEEKDGQVYTDDAYPSIFNGSPFPQLQVLNYYDDYNFPLFGYTVPTTVLGQAVTQNVRGLPTGGGRLVLDGNNDKWVRWARAYDEKGRLITEGTMNELAQTFTQVETKLDFVGRPEQVVTVHTKGANPPIVTVDNYAYDHMGRLTEQTQIIGAHTETIVENTYDELGQLVGKKVGGNLQTVDYEYNVRGWLKAINNTANLGNDLFAFDINYNTADHGGTPLYNGNISETEWKTANVDNGLKWYRYGYDPLNRIINATANSPNYHLNSVGYDKNGNILSLQRQGHTNADATLFGNMDDLVYTYDSGNKLIKVLDNGNDSQGFNDGIDTTTEYTYDANGNMTSDLNKGISSVEYNHLNMPIKITVTGANAGILDYIYAADRTKLRKINSNGTTTDYIGNFVYEGGSLKQITQPEGYIEPDGQGGYDYVYRYVDVWGNTRLTYADDNGDGSIDPANEIRREQNYYPFGLLHKGYNNVVNGVKNNYKTYQSQEFTEDLGLNIHEWKYRISDPAIGRFWQIDPLAEHYSYNSTYAFAENKLGIGRELEGLEVVPHMPPFGKGMTSENLARHQEAQRVANTVATVGQLAMVGGVAAGIAGTEATTAFVANEIKDEALSQATNGASDIFDVTKMAYKGLKNLAEFGFKKLFGKADNVADAFSSSVDDVTDAFTKSGGAGKLEGLKIDDADGNFFQVSGSFDGTDFAFQGDISVSDGVLTIDGGDFEGALGVSGFKEALASFGKSSNVEKVIFNSGKRTTGANPGKTITIEANVKDYFD